MSKPKKPEKSEKLIDLIKKDPQIDLKQVALHDDFCILAGKNPTDDFLNYLFGKGPADTGKLSEILDIILTNEDGDAKPKTVEGDKGTQFSNARKIAHNLCTVFSNKDVKTKKLQEILGSNSAAEKILMNRLKSYINQNSEDSVTSSRFSQLIRNLISTRSELVKENPWLLSPLLAFPDRIGYSTILFTVLRVNPQFYKFAAMRSLDFMTKAEKNERFGKCSFILLNTFSLLIKSDEFKIDHFNVEIMKNILDVTLRARETYRLAFYEGIFITSSILKKVHPKSAISRYVKARGKAFYNSLGLGKMKFEPDIDIKAQPAEFKDIIAAFPAFYKSGFKDLFKLMFCPNNVVSSDFGRICLDYIISMPEMKFIRFIDDNEIIELIMKHFPKLPNDNSILDIEENIHYFNPHVILLAFYIVEGLPENRSTTNNTIKPNLYSPETARSEEFLEFVVKNVLPYRQLVLPDLTKFARTEAPGKLNAD